MFFTDYPKYGGTKDAQQRFGGQECSVLQVRGASMLSSQVQNATNDAELTSSQG